LKRKTRRIDIFHHKEDNIGMSVADKDTVVRETLTITEVPCLEDEINRLVHGFKGLYAQSLDKLPSKTHNLVLLTEKIRLDLPEGLYDFVFRLNGVSVPTRYPEDIERLKKDYNKRNTGSMLKLGKETLKWLKRKSEQ
jgi:hypothetical protein